MEKAPIFELKRTHGILGLQLISSDADLINELMTLLVMHVFSKQVNYHADFLRLDRDKASMDKVL